MPWSYRSPIMSGALGARPGAADILYSSSSCNGSLAVSLEISAVFFMYLNCCIA